MIKGNVIQHDKCLDFILGGKSLFTLLNTKTGNRFTFKVKKDKVSDIYFVSVLTSPDIYSFIGTIFEKNKFVHSKKSKISTDAQSVKVFKYVFNKLVSSELEDYIELWHEGRCGKCGRVLTVPTSISTGFGPDCLRRLNK